jgi:hypothetical protein
MLLFGSLLILLAWLIAIERLDKTSAAKRRQSGDRI